ncbi:CYTH domain-containing protein [Carnobacteriaceae bacterium zg-ZUI78]|nr:CYTH domain-containing protein [Carnobacteriaceae bacterium zg-ZUI78]
MSKELEKELKTGLTESEYHHLYTFLQCDKRPLISQENYYFDTFDNQLLNHKLGLRIRLDDTHGEFTLKVPIAEHEKIEITDIFSLDLGRAYLKSNTFPNGHVVQELRHYNISSTNLIQIGTLKNERYEIETLDGLWVLDKSYFQNGITYELEFEYETNTKPFYDFLEKHGILFKALPSKLARAVNRQA